MEWQVVFVISAIIFFVGNLVYIIFGQMVNQPWDAADFLDKQLGDKRQEEGQTAWASAKAKEANEGKVINDEDHRHTELTS